MGIGIQEYRSRIGLYTRIYCQRNRRLKRAKYTPWSRGTDVHLRSFASGFILTTLFLASFCVLKCHHAIVENYADTSPTESLNNFNRVTFAKISVTITSVNPLKSLYGGHYGAYYETVLMMSGDVEVNPGPSTDTQMILDAINESNTKMTAELDIVKSEIKHVRGDMSALKAELGSIKRKVGLIEEKQKNTEQVLNDFSRKFDQLDYEREVRESDLEYMSMRFEKDSERMELFEQQINILEAERLKCSMRIFGLPELESESKSLLSVLDDKVFCFSPAETLSSKSLTSARRVGTTSNAKPRMVLVNFEHHADKLQLFKSREDLRKSNIRLANDLSYCQRQQIKELNKQGFNGYFKNGVLCKIPKRNPVNQNVTRGYRRGVRTLDDRNREYLNRQSQDNTEAHPMDTTATDNIAQNATQGVE